MGLCAAVGANGLMLAQQSIRHANAAPMASVAREYGSYRHLVQRVLPAVVTVEATSRPRITRAKLPGTGDGPSMPQLPEEFRKKLEEFQGQPFEPRQTPAPHAFGSGVIVDPKGIVLTNDHVVRNADRVQITLQDGRKFTSHDIKRDPKTDLAIVRISAKESLPCLELGDSDATEIGDRVLAIGAPLGLAGTVTTGIISAKGRDVHLNMYEDFLQTDAAINPGNSGGPLVNLDGQIIGINSAIKSETGGFQGIGLAISSNLVKTVMTQLLKDGSVHRGYLGVQVQRLEPQVAARLGLSSGVVISRVSKGSPAARAGLQDGDIVTAVAGRDVKDLRELQQVIAKLPPGKATEFTVLRDGNRKTLPVTIEEQPQDYGAPAGSNDAPSEKDFGPMALAEVGIKIMDMNPALASQLGYPEKTEGVAIVEVEADSMGARAGLVPGTLILKVDKTGVKTAEQARQALKKGSLEKGMVLQVKTPRGGITYVMLSPPSE
jgi:serine protease Do